MRNNNHNVRNNPPKVAPTGKRIITATIGFLAFLSMVLAPAIQARPHPVASELNIRMEDNSVFNIKINRREYNDFSYQYTIGNLNPGRHWVEITRYTVSRRGHRINYIHPQVVLSGHIHIKPNTQVFASIDHRGRYREEKILALRPVPQARGARGNHAPVQPVRTSPYEYYPVAMSPYNFAILKSTIGNTSFDSSRLNIARQAIMGNHVTSQQVYELMTLLTFESNRLNLAEFAFPYTIDPGNYFIVHNAFTFSSSSRRLNQQIAQIP